MRGTWLSTDKDADLQALLDRYGVSDVLLESEFREMEKGWAKTFSEMKALCFDTTFGFTATSDSEWRSFLEHDTVFQLSLNREPGRSILYGLDHVRCRQSFFNQMPVFLRIAVFKEKIAAIDLEPGFLSLDSRCSLNQLIDVCDIGMGHSIYECDFGHRKIVVKHRPYDVQCAYMRLMAVMGWATFDHYFYQNDAGGWEFSESLGRQNCNDFLLSGQFSDHIESALARKAAIGDVLGIGDRHFENYMIQGDDILSVDVSILFWPDNELWSESYISAGLYEITCLRHYCDELPQLKRKWQLFFEHYSYYVEVLSSARDRLSAELDQIFNKTESKRCSAFLEERLSGVDAYVSQQKQLYLNGFVTCLERLLYKERLAMLYARDCALFETRPLYKMMVLADRGRLSAFLHGEKRTGFFDELTLFLSEHDPTFSQDLEAVRAQGLKIREAVSQLESVG